mmetsp:Transcript_23974/g.55344  ORF Transcript_23974/g.55344 Transcript_23974/m.55344 type:complete len:378 (-) Transcript_23974:29-1162(-)
MEALPREMCSDSDTTSNAEAEAVQAEKEQSHSTTGKASDQHGTDTSHDVPSANSAGASKLPATARIPSRAASTACLRSSKTLGSPQESRSTRCVGFAPSSGRPEMVGLPSWASQPRETGACFEAAAAAPQLSNVVDEQRNCSRQVAKLSKRLTAMERSQKVLAAGLQRVLRLTLGVPQGDDAADADGICLDTQKLLIQLGSSRREPDATPQSMDLDKRLSTVEASLDTEVKRLQIQLESLSSQAAALAAEVSPGGLPAAAGVDRCAENGRCQPEGKHASLKEDLHMIVQALEVRMDWELQDLSRKCEDLQKFASQHFHEAGSDPCAHGVSKECMSRLQALEIKVDLIHTNEKANNQCLQTLSQQFAERLASSMTAEV